MSMALESSVVEDQMLTPTPGSPHPYLPLDNSHDRLNSIQLSSDASGEFSVAHSPRTFLGPPGEGLAELRNALNPPWLHGVTGSPSLVTNHSADRAGRWVENARRHADQHQPINFANHANLASLSLGHRMVAPGKVTSLLHQSPVIASSDRSNSVARSSPFDQPTYVNKRGGAAVHRTSNDTSVTRSTHDGHSGDGSSEEEEAWPMPETPFMSNDVWAEALHRKELSKSQKLTSANHHLDDAHKVFPAHQQRKQAAARTQNLPAANSAKEGDRRIGRCKMYNCDKGVGFLIDDRLDQVPQDVKIHWTDIFSDQEFKSLAKGEIVEYTLNITPNGFSASYVTGPGGRPVMGAEQAIVQASRQTSYKLFKAGALPVKTYRSKWESLLSPGESESTAGQSANPSPNVTRPAPTPRTVPNGSDKVAPASAPATAVNRLPNSAGKHSKFTVEQIKGSATEPRNSQKHDGGQIGSNQFNGAQSQLSGGLGSAPLFNTPGLGSLRSPLGYLQSANSLISNFSGAHTPLPALSHAGMTPHSADSYNPFFPAVLTPHLGASARSPIVAMGTPSEPSSHSFMASHSQRGLSQPEFQSFLAERQLLLQQQALLMSMYQSANQPIPASAIQAFNQLSFMNPISKSLLPQQSLHDSQSASADPKAHQFFGLLPPIALPTSKDVFKSVDHMQHTRDAAPWRGADMAGMKRDSSASLRANAVSFTPGGATSAQHESMRKGESGVYQIPGRRSVSDPAVGWAPGGRKLQGPLQQARNANSSGMQQTTRPNGERAGTKRVTFAEHTNTPSRRVVSHGEQVGTPLMMRGLEEEGSNSTAEESLEVSREYISTQLYNMSEDARRPDDFSSVDIALQRLRLAAAPRSLAKHPSSPGQDKIPANNSLTDPSPNISLLIQESGPLAPKFLPDA